MKVKYIGGMSYSDLSIGCIYDVYDEDNCGYMIKINGVVNGYYKGNFEIVNKGLSLDEIKHDKENLELHYNGWKALYDHIEQFGAKSGYEVLIFNVRKYMERAHKKGQMLSDLQKIINYTEKAKELVEKYNLEAEYK